MSDSALSRNSNEGNEKSEGREETRELLSRGLIKRYERQKEEDIRMVSKQGRGTREVIICATESCDPETIHTITISPL